MSIAQDQANGLDPILALEELAPPDYCDPVIETYKDVDRTLLRENLKLSVEGRIRKARSFHESMGSWNEAGRRSRLRTVSEDHS